MGEDQTGSIVLPRGTGFGVVAHVTDVRARQWEINSMERGMYYEEKVSHVSDSDAVGSNQGVNTHGA
jgi:hypothetical protein